jgi:hypothetical protein
MYAATTTTGFRGITAHALPVDEVQALLNDKETSQ